MIECGFGVQIPLHIHAPVHSESHFQGSVPDSGVDSGSDQALLNMKHAQSCTFLFSMFSLLYIYMYVDLYLNIGNIKFYLNVIK